MLPLLLLLLLLPVFSARLELAAAEDESINVDKKWDDVNADGKVAGAMESLSLAITTRSLRSGLATLRARMIAPRDNFA